MHQRLKAVLLQEIAALRQRLGHGSSLSRSSSAWRPAEPPGSARRAGKCSATILSLVWGSRLCRSATRPAIEFSTGSWRVPPCPPGPPPLRRRRSGTAASSREETARQQAMSELAPASPWKAIVFAASPRRALAPPRPLPSSLPSPSCRRYPGGRLFRPPNAPCQPWPAPREATGRWLASDRPRGENLAKSQGLRRSAARAWRRDRILLGVTAGVLRSNALTFWRLGSDMASFNTVAGCVLASALFAMVVGKVSQRRCSSAQAGQAGDCRQR